LKGNRPVCPLQGLDPNSFNQFPIYFRADVLSEIPVGPALCKCAAFATVVTSFPISRFRISPAGRAQTAARHLSK
jgi:hypothetical protein